MPGWLELYITTLLTSPLLRRIEPAGLRLSAAG